MRVTAMRLPILEGDMLYLARAGGEDIADATLQVTRINKHTTSAGDTLAKISLKPLNWRLRNATPEGATIIIEHNGQSIDEQPIIAGTQRTIIINAHYSAGEDITDERQPHPTP